MGWSFPMGSLLLTASLDFAPAENEIALWGSRRQEGAVRRFQFCQPSPVCLELRVFKI